MIKYLTNAQMRAADRYTIETLKHSSLSLMERAGPNRQRQMRI